MKERIQHGSTAEPKRKWFKPNSYDSLSSYVRRNLEWLESESRAWSGINNKSRQDIQNGMEGYSWADHWAERLVEFRRDHGVPENILEVSLGPDGELLKNHLEIFPESNIYVIEENADNISDARAKLISEGYNLSKVTFILGNATNPKFFKKLPEMDLVTNNNLLQHVPVCATEFQKLIGLGEITPLADLLNNMANALSENGVLLTGDLEVGNWDVAAAPGYEDNPEVRELLEQLKFYVNGKDTADGQHIPGAKERGWKLSRETMAWTSADQIRQEIEEATNKKVKYIPDSLTVVENDKITPEDPGAIITAHIPASLVAGIRSALTSMKEALTAIEKGVFMKDKLSDTEIENVKSYILNNIPRMEKSEEFLTEFGKKYLRSLLDRRIVHNLPPHDIQAFQRAQ